jgi:YggT family protein
MSAQIAMVLSFIISVLIVLIVVEVVIENFLAAGKGPSPYNPIVRTMRNIVNPILEPFRRILPASRTGGWDFSPVIVMLILYLVRNMLSRMH